MIICIIEVKESYSKFRLNLGTVDLLQIFCLAGNHILVNLSYFVPIQAISHNLSLYHSILTWILLKILLALKTMWYQEMIDVSLNVKSNTSS